MAGFKGHPVTPLQQGHFVTGLGQIPGAGHTDHATTEYHYVHLVSP